MTQRHTYLELLAGLEKNRAKVKSDFERHSERYVMTVESDDGLNRVIHVGVPNVTDRSFRILSARGILTIAGGMGNFIFRRSGNMFPFFDTTRDPDFGYWAEKVVSGVYEKYDANVFLCSLHNRISEWAESYAQGNVDARIQELFERFQDFANLETEDAALESYRKFRGNILLAGQDFWLQGSYLYTHVYEGDTRRFTRSFERSCYAIAWTVQQYRMSKNRKSDV